VPGENPFAKSPKILGDITSHLVNAGKPRKLNRWERMLLRQLNTHVKDPVTGDYRPTIPPWLQNFAAQPIHHPDSGTTRERALQWIRFKKLASELVHTYGQPRSEQFGDPFIPPGGLGMNEGRKGTTLSGRYNLPIEPSQSVDRAIETFFQKNIGAEPIKPGTVGEAAFERMIARLFGSEQN
jgi:hypothetical protein